MGGSSDLPRPLDTVIGTDSKLRPALGPRLRSYLSASNLLSLVSPQEPQKAGIPNGSWPDLEAVYDETTTVSNLDLNRLVLGLRNRLWYYYDEPLTAAFNGPLLWLTDECLKTSKANNELKARIAGLEQQNQNLVQEQQRNSIKLHRASHSFSGPQTSVDSVQQTHRRQREFCYMTTASQLTVADSMSASEASRRPSLHHLIPGFTSRRNTDASFASIDEVFLPPKPRYVESALSFATSSHSGGTGDMLSDDEEEFKTRQDAAVRLASYVAEKTGELFKNHYSEIAKILRVPVTAPAPAQADVPTDQKSVVQDSSVQESTDTGTRVDEVPTTIQRPRNTNPSQRRIFSFYPGDDNISGSYTEHNHQQRPRILIQPPSSESNITQLKYSNNGQNEPEKQGPPGRDDSNTSVLTNATGAPKTNPKPPNIVRQTSGTSTEVTRSEVSSQGGKTMEKPQGSLAAALAATARFGKKTIRPVPSGTQ